MLKSNFELVGVLLLFKVCKNVPECEPSKRRANLYFSK